MHTISKTTAALALFMTASLTTACNTPDKTVGEAQRAERQELTTEQREKAAAFDRKQQDERSDLRADQARESVNTEMVKPDDQSRYAIDARDRLAKLDARATEMRKVGKKVDASAIAARDAIQTHIQTFDNEPMAKTDWNIHRDQLDSELKALSERLDLISST